MAECPAMRLSLGLATVALAATASPALHTAQSLDAAIDAIAADALKQPLAGLSIAVARRGQPVFARGYGHANLDRDVPVTPDIVFHIDSVSKYVAAVAALSLVET